VFAKAVKNQMVPRVARGTTGQPHFSDIVPAQRLTLFSHIARILDKTDAKKILTASPWELEETIGTPSYYVDEDYPVGPEVQ